MGFQAYHHQPAVLSCSNPTLIMTFLHTVLRTKLTPSSSSIEGKNSLYLHCTSNVAASEVTVPILLLATHRYCPLSDLFTFVIVNCLLSEDKLILGEFTADPPLVHDIDGVGFPVALQDKVTFSPSVGVVCCGCAVIWGWSVKRKQQIIKYAKYSHRKAYYNQCTSMNPQRMDMSFPVIGFP